MNCTCTMNDWKQENLYMLLTAIRNINNGGGETPPKRETDG